MPPVLSCILTVGEGKWFARIGVWGGIENSNTIEWSGIVGPVPASGTLAELALTPIHLQQIRRIEKGVRLYINSTDPCYMIIQCSSEKDFLSSKTISKYVTDWGSGYIDYMGLLPDITYYIRFAGGYKTPSKESITLLGQWVNLPPTTPIRTERLSSNIDLTTKKSNDVLLQHVKENKNYRFTSYTDYLQYKNALARRG